jgi:hypothetical protein
VTRCTGRRGGRRKEALGRWDDRDGEGLTGSEAAPAEEGAEGVGDGGGGLRGLGRRRGG